MGGEVGGEGIDQIRRRERPNIPEIRPYVSVVYEKAKFFEWWEGCRNNELLCDYVNLGCF